MAAYDSQAYLAPAYDLATSTSNEYQQYNLQPNLSPLYSASTSTASDLTIPGEHFTSSNYTPADINPRPAKKQKLRQEKQPAKASAEVKINHQMPANDGTNAAAAADTTAAANKPKRVRTGCLTCRERHLKCDEGLPNCQNCRKSSRTCKRGVRLNFIDTQVQSPPMIPPTADWAGTWKYRGSRNVC